MVSLENRLVHFESSNAFFSTFNICFCLNWLRRGSSVKGKSCLIFYNDLVIGTGDAGMVSLIITVRDISMFWGYYKFFFPWKWKLDMVESISAEQCVLKFPLVSSSATVQMFLSIILFIARIPCNHNWEQGQILLRHCIRTYAWVFLVYLLVAIFETNFLSHVPLYFHAVCAV